MRKQNYVRLDDLAEVILELMSNLPSQSIDTFTICGPENFTDLSFAENICKRLGKSFDYEFIIPEGDCFIDVSNYGIDTSEPDFLAYKIKPRCIDTDFLKKHLDVISKNLSMGS